MRKKISFIIGLISIIINLHGQSNWDFVGPYSNNNLTGTEFETSQMSSIVVDQNNLNHLFASGMFGGLWESNDKGSNWVNINTNSTGVNGVVGMAFKSATELLISNYHPMRYDLDYSNQVSIYNFSSQTWQNLPALPSPGGLPYVIQSVAVHPADHSIYYAGTSVGLFRYVTATNAWTLVVPNCYVENIVFVPKTNGTDYFCYIAGSNANGTNAKENGTAMLQESSNLGNTAFTDLSSNIILPTGYPISHSKICIGPTSGGIVSLFLLTEYYNQNRSIHKVLTSQSTGFQNCTSLIVTGESTCNRIRMGLAYDRINNLLWTGGVYLGCYDLTNNNFNYNIAQGFHTSGGLIHNDFHEITIQGGNMYVAHDGGLAQATLTSLASNPFNISFNRLNNGIHVSLINGFSGSEQNPNLYAIGGQDIVNTDIYDASIQRNKYTHQTWENDGAFIDKFDDNFMLLDASSYNPNYYESFDQGASLNGSYGFYYPKTTSPFESDITSYPETTEFGMQRFKQDPYRKGRIYGLGGAHWANITQYDLASNKFAVKNTLGGYFPNTDWEARLADLSFSPQSPNSVYAITGGRYFPSNGESVSSKVFKYIGPNFDDCWVSHNEYTDALGNPQWQLITPDFANLHTIGGGALDIPISELGKGDLTAIETSPWDKSLIYVTCTIRDNPNVKVMKYDGTTWTNYSLDIPLDEYAVTMVMDHRSNDGIYLSTDKAVYYRSKGMLNWVAYTSGLPIINSKQMEINYKENSVRVGTYGRGIYKSQLYCPHQSDVPLTGSIPADIYEGSVSVTASGIAAMLSSPTAFRGGHYVALNPGFKAIATSTPNRYLLAYIHGCTIDINSSTNSDMFRSSSYSPALQQDGEIERGNDIQIYPNPNNGIFTITMQNEEQASVEVFDVNGRLVYKTSIDEEKTELKLSNIEAGIYLLQITTKSSATTKHKIVIMK